MLTTQHMKIARGTPCPYSLTTFWSTPITLSKLEKGRNSRRNATLDGQHLPQVWRNHQHKPASPEIHLRRWMLFVHGQAQPKWARRLHRSKLRECKSFSRIFFDKIFVYLSLISYYQKLHIVKLRSITRRDSFTATVNGAEQHSLSWRRKKLRKPARYCSQKGKEFRQKTVSLGWRGVVIFPLKVLSQGRGNITYWWILLTLSLKGMIEWRHQLTLALGCWTAWGLAEVWTREQRDRARCGGTSW